MKLLRLFDNFRLERKLFETVGVKKDKVSWPERVSCEDLVFAWSWPDCLYISCKYRIQLPLKNLKALEQKY